MKITKAEVRNFVDEYEDELRKYLREHDVQTDLCVRDAIWQTLITMGIVTMNSVPSSATDYEVVSRHRYPPEEEHAVDAD